MSKQITIVREIMDISESIENKELKDRMYDLADRVVEIIGAYDEGYIDGISDALDAIKGFLGKGE